jgi:prepilin-type N-terminal cleavage/methylation domain-containing protein
MLDHPAGPRDARGFSLIEVIVAMTILAVGLLGLAQAFVIGLNHLSTSSANLIAREKAREAVESVHTARDTRVITWANIRNVNTVAEDDPEWGACNSVGGGVFQNGVQPLGAPGPDGLINTADDGAVEEIRTPGPDGVLGNADDQVQPLANFTREMQICDINNDLREIRVTIRYTVGPLQRQYRLRTFISSFS